MSVIKFSVYRWFNRVFGSDLPVSALDARMRALPPLHYYRLADGNIAGWHQKLNETELESLRIVGESHRYLGFWKDQPSDLQA